MRARLFFGLGVLLGCATAAWSSPVTAVAAENFYGDVLRQIGGADLEVRDVLSNPDADPHLFELSPSVARAVAGADLVVYNGLDYDPWMARLLAGAQRPQRRVIVVAALLQRSRPANPHLWYDPSTMPVLARAAASELARFNPAHQADYARRLQQFLASLRAIDAKIALLRARYQGTEVAATEPICDDLTAAIGLRTLDPGFELATMNDAEPSAADTAQLERALGGRRARVFIYNRQATSTTVQRLLRIAGQARVPVVSVTETEPAGTTYQDWMLATLTALERALAGAPT